MSSPSGAALDPDAAAWLQRLAEAGALPLHQGTPEQARAAHEATAALVSGPGEPVEDVRDDVLGGVPARVYRPGSAVGTTVYVHGGGWVVGTLDTYDALCRSLALRSGSTVVSVGYDLAPAARHPRQVEQVHSVLRAAAEQAAGAGAGPVAVAGDSAGAHLAVLGALRARDTGPVLAALALVYPVVSPALDRPSAHDNAEGYALTTEGMRWYWRQYLSGDLPGDLSGDRPGDLPGSVPAGPVDLLDADLAGLPPALVLTAGFDPLRDEGRALADALEAAGGRVQRVSYDGQIHGFFRMTAVIGAARAAQEQVGAFLRDRLRGGPT